MTESHVLLSLFPNNIIRKTNVLGSNEEIVLSAVVLGPNYMVTLHLGRKLYISVMMCEVRVGQMTQLLISLEKPCERAGFDSQNLQLMAAHKERPVKFQRT